MLTDRLHGRSVAHDVSTIFARSFQQIKEVVAYEFGHSSVTLPIKMKQASDSPFSFVLSVEHAASISLTLCLVNAAKRFI